MLSPYDINRAQIALDYTSEIEMTAAGSCSVIAPKVALVIGAMLTLTLMTGCAQRVHLSPEQGMAHASYFTQQVNSPTIRLAPTTAEDAKRISKSRAKRSSTSSSKGSGRFGVIGGS